MSYAEMRKGKATGRWCSEKVVNGKRFRRFFDLKKDADGYEGLCRAHGL
jgi:hypothetical protein